MTTTLLPTSSDVQQAELEALRLTALALRDLRETTAAAQATLTVAGGTLIIDDDGCHLLSMDGGDPVDLTDWIDYAGMVPA